MKRFPLRALVALASLFLSACNGGGTTTPAFPSGPAPTASGAPSTGSAATPSASTTATPNPSTTATPNPSGTATPTPSASSVAATIPFPAASDSDAFYAQPNPFPNLAPGGIIASRSVTYAPVGGAPMPNAAWQLKFVSRDTNGQPIAAVATVVKPVTPATGVAPLLAVQFAEDSLGAQCAPSHNETGSTVDYVEQLEAAEPAQGLALGWTIVVPDHEGPTSAYAAGPLAGQITLDSIRAAERFAPLGLSATTPVGMTGYSGGAIATAWAASLQKNYAPELKIVALASGGTPADVKGIVQNIDTNTVANTAFFNLILSAVVGVNRVYPTLLTPILNAQGVAAATSLENGCLGATSNGAAAPSGQVTDYTTTSDPFDAPNVVALLPKITLPLANNAPIANAFVYHSQLDELIPIAGADAMVAGWCAAGSTVEYYRGVSGDHVGFEATLSTLVYAYLASRFNGTATVVPPGSTTCN